MIELADGVDIICHSKSQRMGEKKAFIEMIHTSQYQTVAHNYV